MAAPPVDPFAHLPLPMLWEKKFDPRVNRYYFIDHLLKTTTWEDPRSRFFEVKVKPAMGRQTSDLPLKPAPTRPDQTEQIRRAEDLESALPAASTAALASTQPTPVEPTPSIAATLPTLTQTSVAADQSTLSGPEIHRTVATPARLTDAPRSISQTLPVVLAPPSLSPGPAQAEPPIGKIQADLETAQARERAKVLALEEAEARARRLNEEQQQQQQPQRQQQRSQPRQPRQPVDLRASKPLSPPPHPATADANSESVSPMTSSAHSTTSRDFASPPSVQASPLSFRNPEAPAPIRPPPLLHSASVPVLKAADRATEPTETANPAVSRIKAEADSAATSTPPSPRRGSDLAPPPLPTAEEEEHSALKRPALVHRHSLEYRVRALTFLTLPSNFPSPVCWTGVFVSFLPAGLLLLQSRNRDDPNAPSSPRRPSSVLEVRSDSVIPGLDVEDPRPKQIENIVHSAENLLPQIDAFLIEAKTLLFPIDGMRRNQRYLKELLVRKIKKLSEIDTADSDPLCVLAYSALQRIQAIQKKLDIPL
eukprot:m.504573 g.504573  ORF g.504573 m.504573 type:complete len:538 (+) comp57355_c0_seq11:228-1841(+)